MKTTVRVMVWVLVLWAGTPAWAGDCQRCHAAFDAAYMRPAVPELRVRAQGRTEVTSLAELYQEHGHPCVGTGIAFRAVRLGLQELYGKAVPNREDLVIFSHIAGPGVVDALDRIMRGPTAQQKTKPPKGMQLARENFVFTLVRKSTGRTVTVSLKPEILSADFFPLKMRMKKQGLNPQEWEVLHGHIRQAVGEVLRRSDEQLFEVRGPEPVVSWGSAAPRPAGKRNQGAS